MATHRRLQFLSIAAVLLFVFAGLRVATAVLAQTSQQPIALGDNKPGQITADDPAPAFVFSATAGQNVNVLVLSLTPGFAPGLRIVDPSGAQAQNETNASGANSVQAALTATQAGSYQLIVQTANGVGGQFVISVQAASAAPATPVPSIPIDAPMTNSVDASTTSKRFAFNADPAQPLTLRVTSVSVAGGPSVTLADGATGEVLGSSGPRVLESSYKIAPGSGSYLVQIDFGNTSPVEQFIIALDSVNGTGGSSNPVASPTTALISGPTVTLVPIASPTDALIPLPVTGPCVVASAGADRVNIRSGPGIGNGIITQITLTQIIPVTGRLGDNTWFQVSVSGLIGWVSTSVVRVGGDCGGVPMIALPTSTPEPSATAAPTEAPTATPPILVVPTIAPTFHLNATLIKINPLVTFVLLQTPTPTKKFIMIDPGTIHLIMTPGP